MFKSIKSYVLPVGLACALLVMGTQTTIQAAEKKAMYVSSQGSADNDGLSAETPTTFAAAYKNIADIDTVFVMDDMTYAEPPAHDGMITIKGYSDGVDLTLGNALNAQGDLTISNVNIIRGADNYHIYANGHTLVIAEDVTSSQRLFAFGGTNGKAYTGDTDIQLLGGNYERVFGGSSNATVTGNTNIVFGGNANIGIDFSKETRVYGGGNSGDVTGETNVTLSGNAVCQYLFGGSRKSSGTSDIQKINVNIAGGRAMNIFGGTESNVLQDCDVNVKMTGGTVEAIFAGSIAANLNGNVNVDLMGGNVTRRLYTGCYNDTNLTGSYKTDNHVTGTTSLRIYPSMPISNIASGNDIDGGVYLGSRYSSSFADETNTLIFADGCYDAYKNKVKQVHGGDYVVSATTGGDVKAAEVGGSVNITAEPGKYATVNGSGEYETATVALANTGSTVNTVNFADYNFKLHDMSTSAKVSKITANVTLTANNNGETVYAAPKALIAVYDDNGSLVTSAINENINGSAEKYTFEIPCAVEREREYTVKAMLWNVDGSLQPLSNCVVKTVKIGEKTALKQVMESLSGDYTLVITADKLN